MTMSVLGEEITLNRHDDSVTISAGDELVYAIMVTNNEQVNEIFSMLKPIVRSCNSNLKKCETSNLEAIRNEKEKLLRRTAELENEFFRSNRMMCS